MPLEHLKNRIAFFQEIGAEFLVLEKRSSPSAPAPRSRRDDSLLRALEQEILSCQRCPLHRERTQAVPGEGAVDAELLFVGEAPGHEEDIQGRPFVGRAGQLLTKIIAAMGFDRKDVYITNVCKCRPPKNRTPTQEETAACAPFLLRQVEILQPKVIVALGKSPADFFAPSSLGISAMRGRFHDFRGIPVMPTFHPSYLVRNEGNKELKRMVWKDMQEVMALLGKR